MSLLNLKPFLQTRYGYESMYHVVIETQQGSSNHDQQTNSTDSMDLNYSISNMSKAKTVDCRVTLEAKLYQIPTMWNTCSTTFQCCWSITCSISESYPYEKELYQNICDIYLKYIAHICKLYVFTMSVYVSYMYMLHICRIRSNIYVTFM